MVDLTTVYNVNDIRIANIDTAKELYARVYSNKVSVEDALFILEFINTTKWSKNEFELEEKYLNRINYLEEVLSYVKPFVF